MTDDLSELRREIAELRREVGELRRELTAHQPLMPPNWPQPDPRIRYPWYAPVITCKTDGTE